MAQQILTLLERGDAALAAINANFTELYGNLTQPMKFKGQAATFSFVIPANTQLVAIWAVLATGGPVTYRVGVTPNGTELSLDVTPDANAEPVKTEQYFAAATTIYITYSGTAGTLNFRFNVIPNFF